MPVTKKATISVDKAREMQRAIAEGAYSFGYTGALNIRFAKKEHETHGELKKRVAALANDLHEQLGLTEEQLRVSKGQIVVLDPDQNMPFILAELGINVDWQSFAKDVEVTKSPSERPSSNAVFIAYVKPPASPARRLIGEDPNFRPPTTFVGRILLEDAKPNMLDKIPSSLQDQMKKDLRAFLTDKGRGRD